MDTLNCIHPELSPYISEHPRFGFFINSPFISGPVVRRLPNICTPSEWLSWQYEWARAQADYAIATCDWHAYVFVHARAHRGGALLEVIRRNSVANELFPVLTADLRELVSNVWTDCECPSANLEDWEFIWGVMKESKQLVMDAEERELFNALPSEIAIYRGVSAEDEDDLWGAVCGYSWTIDRRTAEWFAKRFAYGAKRPFVLKATIPKADVYAYLIGRKESEIVVDPERVLEWDWEEITVEVAARAA